MDQEQHSCSFQDVNMTYKQLVKAILSEYPEAEVSYSIPDVPIKEIAVQYRETDWQFLKRMLSMLHAPLACNPAGETIQLYAGVPEIPYRDWGYEITGFRKEMGEFQYWQQSGMGRGDDCFQVAELQTGCMAGLYESLKVFGQRLSVRGISGKLEKGAFRCRCELQKAEGILARTEYPMHLVGSALKGKVLRPPVPGFRYIFRLMMGTGSRMSIGFRFPPCQHHRMGADGIICRSRETR